MTGSFPNCRRLALSSRLSGAPSRSALSSPCRVPVQSAGPHGRPSALRVSGRRYSSTNAKARPQQQVPTPSSSPLPPPPVSSLPPNLKHDLRTLLRELAQPVAVLTSLMPSPSPSSRPSSPNAPKHKPSKKENKHHRPSTHGPSPPLYHGATLSSFTSIAMDPYPLVCFALRVPSRMADGLREAVEQEERENRAKEEARVKAEEAARAREEEARAKGEENMNANEEVREDGTVKLEKHRKWRAPPDPDRAHMVINLLSRGQEEAAVRFSRPDLYPTPFAEPVAPRPPSPSSSSPPSSSSSSSSPSSSSSSSAKVNPHKSHKGKREPNLPTPTPCTLSKEGFPILLDSLGALSCRLVAGPIPLHDVSYLSQLVADSSSSHSPSSPLHTPSPSQPGGRHLHLGKGEVASQLFIARVVRVEDVPRLGEGKEGEGLKPLIYHRRGYTTCEEVEEEGS